MQGQMGISRHANRGLKLILSSANDLTKPVGGTTSAERRDLLRRSHHLNKEGSF